MIVIGVDGAPLSLIEPWVRDGHLPGFSRLMEEGAWGPLRTILPPVTAPAWSSFMTGKAPGKHGVYEFFYRTDDSFQTLPVSSRSIDGAKLWDLIGASGRTVGVLNVPVTYPVSRVNGYVVSGLMTPKGTREMTYPPDLLTEIEREVGGPYRMYTEMVHAKGRVGRLLTDYHGVLEYRIKTPTESSKELSNIIIRFSLLDSFAQGPHGVFSFTYANHIYKRVLDGNFWSEGCENTSNQHRDLVL